MINHKYLLSFIILGCMQPLMYGMEYTGNAHDVKQPHVSNTAAKAIPLDVFLNAIDNELLPKLITKLHVKIDFAERMKYVDVQSKFIRLLARLENQLKIFKSQIEDIVLSASLHDGDILSVDFETAKAVFTEMVEKDIKNFFPHGNDALEAEYLTIFDDLKTHVVSLAPANEPKKREREEEENKELPESKKCKIDASFLYFVDEALPFDAFKQIIDKTKNLSKHEVDAEVYENVKNQILVHSKKALREKSQKMSVFEYAYKAQCAWMLELFYERILMQEEQIQHQEKQIQYEEICYMCLEPVNVQNLEVKCFECLASTCSDCAPAIKVCGICKHHIK